MKEKKKILISAAVGVVIGGLIGIVINNLTFNKSISLLEPSEYNIQDKDLSYQDMYGELSDGSWFIINNRNYTYDFYPSSLKGDFKLELDDPYILINAVNSYLESNNGNTNNNIDFLEDILINEKIYFNE